MTKPAISFESPKNQDDIDIFGAIISESLTFPPATEYDWVSRIGLSNILLARVDGTIAGGVNLLHMGQFFGGRSLPMVGIHGVAVSPEFRGQGVGTALMRAALQRIRAGGNPISSLYPATQEIYRKVGYEQAGDRIRYGFPTSAFPPGDRNLALARYDSARDPQIRTLYREKAALCPGHIDRSDYNWERVTTPRIGPAFAYLVLDGRKPVGYVFFTQTRDKPPPFYRIDVLDMLAAVPDAALRIFSMFADHRSMAKTVTWYGAPADPSALLMREQEGVQQWRMTWMLRIVDVPVALSMRGYPSKLRSEIHLEIDDETIAENAGRWILKVEDGRGSARQGGRGTLKTNARGLATLFSGFLSARQLVRTGLMAAPEEELAQADQVFSGPMPWMVDMF